MTLSVINGIHSLLGEIMEERSLSSEKVDNALFLELVGEVFVRISLLGRWTEVPSWGSIDYSSDELLMFSLG